MNAFYNTKIEEQETIITIDYFTREVYIYTSQKDVYRRIVKRIGQPNYTDCLKGKTVSGRWIIPFSERKMITQILSRPTLIGNRE